MDGELGTLVHFTAGLSLSEMHRGKNREGRRAFRERQRLRLKHDGRGQASCR